VEAERLLAEECGRALPLVGKDATPVSLERIRYAALRVSGGDLERLHQAVKLAQLDWRDLLMAAGFGDVGAHLSWSPRRFDPQMAEAWQAGIAPAGVEFALGARVEIVPVETPARQGIVVSLIGIEPAPLYLVELSARDRIEVSQARMRRIA
jgi:hypothetical protein